MPRASRVPCSVGRRYMYSPFDGFKPLKRRAVQGFPGSTRPPPPDLLDRLEVIWPASWSLLSFVYWGGGAGMWAWFCCLSRYSHGQGFHSDESRGTIISHHRGICVHWYITYHTYMYTFPRSFFTCYFFHRPHFSHNLLKQGVPLPATVGWWPKYQLPLPLLLQCAPLFITYCTQLPKLNHPRWPDECKCILYTTCTYRLLLNIVQTGNRIQWCQLSPWIR